MKEPLFVAFSTQKGGAGKTTLTVLVASYLHYVKGYNIAVVDCDFPQYSIKDMRERDMRKVEQNKLYAAQAYDQFKKLGKRAYAVIESRPEEAITRANSLLTEESDLDFVLFDLPGTINNPAVIDTISTMDYIFCPIAADRVVLESSMQFATMVNDQLMSTGKANIKGLYMLWNLVDKREKSELYTLFEELAGQMGLSILATTLPDSKRFRREAVESGEKALFRSTLFPPDKSLIKGSSLEELTREILTIMNVG